MNQIAKFPISDMFMLWQHLNPHINIIIDPAQLQPEVKQIPTKAGLRDKGSLYINNPTHTTYPELSHKLTEHLGSGFLACNFV